VAQAIDALRTALNQIRAAFDSRQFEKASAIGYGKVAEEFVFLQGTLGGLQGACLQMMAPRICGALYSATSSGTRRRPARTCGSTASRSARPRRVSSTLKPSRPRTRTIPTDHPDWSLAPASGTLRGVRRSWRPHPNHHRPKGVARPAESLRKWPVRAKPISVATI
jgi:hypothetical protein